MTLAGGGHLSCAQSLKEMLADKYQVEIINVYKDIIHSKNEDNYNKILKYNLSSLYWPVFVKIFRLQLWLFRDTYIRCFSQYFVRHKFDLVISVVPFLNEIISLAVNTKLIILPTDLANPFPNYWFAKADLIVTCTEHLYMQAQECGYNNIEPIPTLPLRQEFYLPPKTVEKPNLKKNVLITFGKTPANRIYSVINEISSLDGINLSVICGENSYIYRKIKTMSNIIAYQFVNNIHELIDDNDIIITKPGPTTIFEILARGKYMLIENNAKTMLHEKYNIDFILENKLGQSFATIKELKEKILSIDISNKSKYQFSSPREQIKQIISRQLPD